MKLEDNLQLTIYIFVHFPQIHKINKWYSISV